jgi:hypothetical protein
LLGVSLIVLADLHPVTNTDRNLSHITVLVCILCKDLLSHKFSSRTIQCIKGLSLTLMSTVEQTNHCIQIVVISTLHDYKNSTRIER